MKTYLVGGAVRDALRGVPSSDLDYVMVGANEEHLLKLGYIKVGADFPVYLHPFTGHEYAMARRERKVGDGYHGFEVDIREVTLVEDLSRRDLTVNAMAQDENGELIDPFSGKSDLQAKVLRHVGPHFVEDPVRVLRIARFLAKFGSQWTVAPETLSLLKSMVQAGATDHLQVERVWKELERGLMEDSPQRMFELFEAIELSPGTRFSGFNVRREGLRFLREAAASCESLETRFALAFSSVAHAQKLPASAVTAAQTLTKLLAAVPSQAPGDISATARFELLEKMDAIRQGPRTVAVLQALKYFHTELANQLVEDWYTVSSFDTQTVSQTMPKGPEVGRAIRNARIALLS